jgi:3-deoxy-manno-octulosonate cytidylyltransferase (CMP-KDO synthetase)
MPARGEALKAVAVIPARIGSTRLPEKMLLRETGLPLVVHVLQRVRQASRLSGVIVATDDERIRRVVEDHGGVARLTRPDHRTGSDRIGELLPEIDADLLVNVQGDEPEVDPGLLDGIVDRMAADPEADVGTGASPISRESDLHDANCVKVVLDVRQRALYFSRSPIPGGRGGPSLAAAPLMHVGVYAYRRRALEAFLKLPPGRLEIAESLEQLRLLEAGFRFAVVLTPSAGRGIDTTSDYAEFVRRVRERAARTPG